MQLGFEVTKRQSACPPFRALDIAQRGRDAFRDSAFDGCNYRLLSVTVSRSAGPRIGPFGPPRLG